MNRKLRIKKYKSTLQLVSSFGAVISLGTYLLVTVARWFHPAIFTDAISFCVLLAGMILLLVSLAGPHSRRW